MQRREFIASIATTPMLVRSQSSPAATGVRSRSRAALVVPPAADAVLAERAARFRDLILPVAMGPGSMIIAFPLFNPRRPLPEGEPPHWYLVQYVIDDYGEECRPGRQLRNTNTTRVRCGLPAGSFGRRCFAIASRTSPKPWRQRENAFATSSTSSAFATKSSRACSASPRRAHHELRSERLPVLFTLSTPRSWPHPRKKLKPFETCPCTVSTACGATGW